MATASEFWTWFCENSARLAAITRSDTPEPVRSELYGTLNDRFVASFPDIIAEVGPVEDESMLVVSADGNSDHFPAVIACVAEAPVVPGWRIVAFRPRGPSDIGISISGANVKALDMRLVLEPAGEKVDIVFLLRADLDLDDGQLGQIAYLMLDGLLGEWDVEMHVWSVGYHKLDPGRTWPEEALSFADARAEFDRLIAPHRRPH